MRAVPLREVSSERVARLGTGIGELDRVLGGGIVPGGASCTDEATDAYGNGGVHVFDISSPGVYQYAQMFVQAVDASSPTYTGFDAWYHQRDVATPGFDVFMVFEVR